MISKTKRFFVVVKQIKLILTLMNINNFIYNYLLILQINFKIHSQNFKTTTTLGSKNLWPLLTCGNCLEIHWDSKMAVVVGRWLLIPDWMHYKLFALKVKCLSFVKSNEIKWRLFRAFLVSYDNVLFFLFLFLSEPRM